MSDGIYVSMNGAAARMAQLDSVSDNLANVQTPGFKAERPSFEAFLAKADTKGEATKVYAAAVGTRVDLSPGAVVQTNDPMDILPSGKSFIGVQTDKGIALTRAGHVMVSKDGTLTAAGFPIVDRTGKPMVAPQNSTVRIESSGAVFANDTRLGEIGLFEANGAVDRIGPSLLAPQDIKTITPSTDTLRIGNMETGNSSALEAAVQLVSAQRHFETSIQALQTYKKLDDRVTEVGRVR
jgi:flagellar basal-body rod protein FlgF